jgi:hypothetical protein
LTLVANNGPCDASNTTCVVTAVDGDDCPAVYVPCHACMNCGHDSPAEMRLALSGIKSRGYGCDCSQLNGVYILQRQTPIYWDSTCRWTYILPQPVCGYDRLDVILVWGETSVTLMVWLYTPNAGMGFWFQKQYDERPIACDQLNDVIPLRFDHYNDCDCSEATCTVTAL